MLIGYARVSKTAGSQSLELQNCCRREGTVELDIGLLLDSRGAGDQVLRGGCLGLRA